MSAQQQPVKVTLQSQRAGDSAKHNDRTMYRNGYFNELAPQDGLTNYHWSQETMGIGSEAREREVYEALFSEKVVQINESRKKHYRKDVYDLENPRQREQALEEYRWKHPPRETIFQIGSMDNPIDREQAKEILLHQGKRLEQMDSEHFVLLSYDIHMDEGSPHMHARYLMLDERGEVNAEGGLRALGVEPPVSYDKWAKEQNEKRAQRAEKNGKQYKTVKPKSSTNNNRLMTFTKNMRESFEELVEEYGISINTHRTRKKHLTQRAEKAERERAEVERKRAEDVDKKYAAKHQEMQLWKDDLEELSEREDKVAEAYRNDKEAYAERIEYLEGELAKTRKERKEKEDEYITLIQGQQSKTKEAQRDIDRLKEETRQGRRFQDLSNEYDDVRHEAVKTVNDVNRDLRLRGQETPLYIGDKEVTEEYLNEMMEKAEIWPYMEENQREEVLGLLSAGFTKWREYDRQMRESGKNPFKGKSKEEMEEIKRKLVADPAKVKKAADQQKKKYIKTTEQNYDIRNNKKPHVFVPPTQQDQEEKDDGFEIDF